MRITGVQFCQQAAVTQAEHTLIVCKFYSVHVCKGGMYDMSVADILLAEKCENVTIVIVLVMKLQLIITSDNAEPFYSDCGLVTSF